MSQGFDWSSAGRYYDYMNFSEKDVEERYRTYLPWFEGCSRVADLGCGAGIFLGLMKEKGIDAVGVDLDPEQVRKCQEKGLKAEVGDAVSFASKFNGEFDGFFCSHVVEHMASEGVTQVVAACLRALKQDGRLVIVTPNPEALHVHLLEFWRDPTHVRMYSKEALSYIVASQGFQIERAEDSKALMTGRDFMINAFRPGKWWTKIAMRPIMSRLDRLLAPLGLGSGNELFVVAVKK